MTQEEILKQKLAAACLLEFKNPYGRYIDMAIIRKIHTEQGEKKKYTLQQLIDLAFGKTKLLDSPQSGKDAVKR